MQTDTSTTIDIQADNENRVLMVSWADGHNSRFPYAWLRHSLYMGAFPGGVPTRDWTTPSADIRNVSLSSIELDDKDVRLSWQPEGIETTHDLIHLRRDAPSAEERRRRKHRPTLWFGEDAAALPRFDWAELGRNEDRLFDVMLSVQDYGLAKIRNLDPESGAIEKLSAFFGPIHETGYGRLFDVKTDSAIALGANTSKELGPHTDENYRHAPPGITMFHCLVAHPESGGVSTLVDGFQAAELLRETDTDAFDILTRTRLEFRDSSQVDDYRARGRVICLDEDGDYAGIRYTDRTIAPLDLDEEAIEPTYRALVAFASILAEQRLVYRHLLKPGEVHIFDNQRILHGRTEFNPTVGPRHLQQCAVDRDEFHRNLRMLARKRMHPAADQIFASGALI